MRLLKFHLISLLITLALLFNIERLDLSTENTLNIQTFVYVLALIITVAILFLPIFSQHRVTVAIAFALGLYLASKLIFFRDRPFFGGFATYVTTTEMAFLAIIAFISQRFSQSLYEFQQGFEMMALHRGGQHLRTINKARADIRREITRSRHYHRPLSVIVIEPNQHSLNLALPNIFEELQREIVKRFARVKLAQTMKNHLRLMDLILEEDDDDRFIILCPEVGNQGSAVIIDRIQTVMTQIGVDIHCSTAAFPEDALTFEGLVNQAKTKLPNTDHSSPKEVAHTSDIIY